jgi:iron complex transport system substrate-binding protein
MTVKDQLNRTVLTPNPPKRIISLVPSQTELLVDLGVRERLVGITKFCIHPKNIRKEITVVGGTKTVNYNKIRELQPDLIICNKEENTLEMVQELEKTCPVWLSDIATIEDSIEMIELLGTLLNVGDKASNIAESISSEKKKFELFMKAKPTKKVAYLIWKNPFMAAGNGTFIDALLLLNNFQNIFSEKRYPEITIDALAEADLVLLSSEPFPFKETDVSELSANLDANVQLVDGEYFSWYGSRLEKAFAYFRTLH